jgi:uncharacterized protein (DUF58 family)
VEALLTKPRTVFVLCVVLFWSALNRHDPIVYTMAVTLTLVGGLGYLLPWLAMRTATLERAGQWPQQVEVMQDEPLDLALRLRQAGWCPAWLVEVEARWEWAEREFTTAGTVAFLPPRSSVPALGRAAFPCRGVYRLDGLRLRSGFPLGLVQAERRVSVGDFTVLVKPAARNLQLPSEWTVSEDAAGDAAEGHSGESLELNMLRAYEPGESVRRVDWRASARAGELVVRQFQHPASVLVKVLVDLPGANDVGRPDSPREQAVRVAASVCAYLEQQAVRFRLLLPGLAPVTHAEAVPHTLAGAQPPVTPWAQHLTRVAASLAHGEQVVAVVGAAADAGPLLQAAREAQALGARVVVVIATWPEAGGALLQAATLLQAELRQAGVEALLAWR